MADEKIDCPECEGDGVDCDSEECQTCEGEGEVEVDEVNEVLLQIRRK